MGLIVALILTNASWATVVALLLLKHASKEQLWNDLMDDAAEEHQRLKQEIERSSTHDVLGYPKR